MDFRELQDERRYWARLRDRAQAEGGTGETFTRCIDSLDREIADREAECLAHGCEMHSLTVAARTRWATDEIGRGTR